MGSLESKPESNIASRASQKERRQFAVNKAQYGDKIRARRIACGLNQPKLAALLGVANNTISNWEAGRSRPDINQLTRLCASLETTVSWFLDAPEQSSDLTKDERRHFMNYRALSVPNKQAVDRLIDAMIDIADNELYERCKKGFERLRRNSNKTAAGPLGNELSHDDSGEYVYVRTSRNVCLADEIITVTGDSMEPTFHDGDDLLIEYANQLKPGEIGIFVADGTGFVKEYQPDGLHSHNPHYPVLKFYEDDNVRCVGRVLGVLAADQYANSDELAVLEEMRRRTGKKN